MGGAQGPGLFAHHNIIHHNIIHPPHRLHGGHTAVLAIELRTFTLLVMAGRMQWHRWVETLLACNNSRIRVSGGGIGGGDGDNNSGNGTGTGGTT